MRTQKRESLNCFFTRSNYTLCHYNNTFLLQKNQANTALILAKQENKQKKKIEVFTPRPFFDYSALSLPSSDFFFFLEIKKYPPTASTAHPPMIAATGAETPDGTPSSRFVIVYFMVSTNL